MEYLIDAAVEAAIEEAVKVVADRLRVFRVAGEALRRPAILSWT